MSPLRQLRSIKLKLGLVIVAAMATTTVSMLIAIKLGFRPRWGVVASTVLALVVVQLLARGMTSPLREMARAAAAMARGEHGQTVAVRGHDEVAQLGRAFNKMSAELAETDRMRRDLVANVSHELRTPLSAMQASLENMIDGVEAPDAASLSAMNAQLQRLNSMVEQLLDLSRMEARETALELSTFPAQRLLERARAERAHDGQASVAVRVDPPDLCVHGDEERLLQVVSNLLDNALRYAPNGEVVELAAVKEGTGVRLEVTDAGPGIAHAERGRVFERFYRIDGSRSRPGAGLGLAIARWIVGMHEGTISVSDSAGQGCRMLVKLPESASAGRG